jgi:impB/mucB/samB family
MPPRTQPQPAPTATRLDPVSRTLACAWVADLPTWALQRLEPKLREQPVVVLEGRRAAGVCERARRAGVKRGDAVDRVRALCPDAALAQLEPSALSAAWDAALEAMHRVTPWIEPMRPGVAYLAGITALDAEALSSELGLRVGVAHTRSAALLAALAARGARLVQDDAAFLSRVPVYLLRGAGIPAEIVSRLALFGLKTLGDIFLRVTATQLEAQFGQDGALLWSLVTGGDARPVPVYTPPSSLQSSWTFDPLALEPCDWSHVLEHLVSSVTDRLGSRVTGTVTVTLATALGESSARQVLKWYTADRRTLLNVTHRLVLEAHPGLEFERITLAFSDLLKPTPYQESLFGQLERPHVREAIKVVHQRYPDRIGRLEIVRPNAPLKERRFRFKAMDGEEPRVKRKSAATATPPTPKRVRKKR